LHVSNQYILSTDESFIVLLGTDINIIQFAMSVRMPTEDGFEHTMVRVVSHAVARTAEVT